MAKTRLNISLDQDLADFAKIFAAENRMSVADMITQYFLTLKRGVEGEYMKTIIDRTDFRRAMENAQDKLRDGTAQWYSYEEVFED